MNTNHLPDKEILHILEENPQRGMTLLVEQYFGLIWAIISKYLSDSEDIKECVNDTFTKFYFQREHYDEQKASLAVYLSAIARNLAISCYRKESSRKTEVLSSEYAFEDKELHLAEIRSDIQKALNSLKQEDADLIRMKYYGGMSIQEIADSLQLPYETVKKRHQRAIKKLSRLFLLVLIGLIISFLGFKFKN